MKFLILKCLTCIVVLPLFLLPGCSNSFSDKSLISFADLVKQIADTERIARLDVQSSAIITSCDPAGGNNDFNHFLRKSTKGWVVLADLKGPGYVSRFWFTGPDANHGIRMFFDGESEPRIDTTIGELFGRTNPFLPPLACYENYCWYSFVPIPYAKRIVIETQEGGYKPGNWPRLFYQVNYCSLPKGQRVLSFPRTLSSNDLAACQMVRQAWNIGASEQISSKGSAVATNVTLQTGTASNLFLFTGPAVIRSLSVQPDYSQLASPAIRERILRDIVLCMTWNDSAFHSVEVPLGDFFGSVWQRTPYQSMFFGMSNDVFVTCFPMPFRSSARISLENQGDSPVSLRLSAVVKPLKSWDPAWGYFHSGWYRTTPNDVGRPHPVLKVKGRGKYVGCILAVTGLDGNYWILEGDESIRIDNEVVPSWKGTGLEDYFNGGWYYQNVMTRPLHGLPFKAPFRTVQYCVHLTDPVLFKSSVDMIFERGPDNASRGWMESVAFYYMDKPSPAFSRIGVPAERVPPPDPMSKATVMLELWNYERFNDYNGASEFIDAYLERYNDFPFASVLRLRQVAYKERLNGIEFVRAAYENVLATETNNAVLQFTDTILWYHQNPSNALLGAYCNMRAKVFLDGREIGESGDPKQMMVWRLQLLPGKHVLALQAQWHQYPDWVQICLRTHYGDVITAPDWKHAINPSGDWKNVNYDDSSWAEVGGTGVKGPPEEPYVWVVPDPFVDMQSKAIGLRPSLEWPNKRGTVVYRKTFEIR